MWSSLAILGCHTREHPASNGTGGAAATGGVTGTGIGGVTATGGAIGTGGFVGAGGGGGGAPDAGTPDGGAASPDAGPLAGPCSVVTLNLPGAAYAAPTILQAGAGLAAVWTDIGDQHIYGARVNANALAPAWTSSFTVGKTLAPAVWNGTQIAATWTDSTGVNLVTLGEDGSTVAGPFAVAATTSGLPAAIAWSGTEYGIAWSNLSVAAFVRVSPQGAVLSSQALTGYVSPPNVQWDGDSWLIVSAMYWTISEPARVDVTRLDATGQSIGRQTIPMTRSLRSAQATEIGDSIFVVFTDQQNTSLARLNRTLTAPATVVPLSSPYAVEAVGIAARGSTLGVSTLNISVGAATHFIELDQSGAPVRADQVITTNPTSSVLYGIAPIIATSTGWAVAWEDFTDANYFDARVGLVNCYQ